MPKAAVNLHPSIGEEIEAEMNYHIKRAPHVVAAVAAAIELFPPAPRTGGRPPRAENEEQARARRQHLWKYRAGTWRCEICRDWLNAAALPAYRRRQTCRGCRIEDDASRLATRGHKLCRASSDLPFVICLACGAWGNRRTRLLAGPCRVTPTAAGAQAVKRVGQGWHPMLRKDAQGRDLPRDRAEVTHRYCPDRGQWLALEPEDVEVASAEGEQMQDADNEPETDGPQGRDGGSCTCGVHDAALGDDMDYQEANREDEWDQEQDVFAHGGDLDDYTMDVRSTDGRAEDTGSGPVEGQETAAGAANGDATAQGRGEDGAGTLGTDLRPLTETRRDANRKRSN